MEMPDNWKQLIATTPDVEETARNVAAQAIFAIGERIIDIVQRNLNEVIGEQDTVRRMNKHRIGDKSHEKYQREIDRLTAMLLEIKRLEIKL